MPNLETAITVFDDHDGAEKAIGKLARAKAIMATPDASQTIVHPAAEPVMARTAPPAAAQFHIGA